MHFIVFLITDKIGACYIIKVTLDKLFTTVCLCYQAA